MSFIEIEAEDIQSVINSVKIIEDRFSENAEIRLNNDQILVELTNLFYKEDSKNVKELGKKTQRFLDMLLGTKETSRPPLVPIINAIKVLMLADDDEEIDVEYERDNDVSMIRQEDYMKRFVSLKDSKNMTLDTVTPQLYLWTRQWKEPTVQKGVQMTFTTPVDAVTMKNERIRLAGESQYFSGDRCDVVGVIVESPTSKKSSVHTFSIPEYFQTLKSFQKDDTITMCVNDFFEELGGFGDRCNHRAVITEVSTHGVVVNNVINVPYDQYCPIMLFKENDKNYFSKRDFYLHDTIEILFDNQKSFEANAKFAYPVCASEALFMNFDKVKTSSNLYEIEKYCLRPWGYTLDDLDYVSLSKIKQALRHIQPNTKPQHHVSRQNKKYVSLPNILDVVQNWKEFCKAKRSKLQKLVNKIDKYESELKVKIRELESQQSKDNCENSSLGRVAKRVKRYQDLSTSDLVFDVDQDFTKYNLKKLIVKETPNIEEGTLKQRVRDEVIKLKLDDVDFEVESIMNGYRKIRPGDLAVLSVNNVDLVFKLSMIQNKPMWVRVFKAPYKSCDDAIVRRSNSNSKASKATCLYDSYDKMCKSIDNARINHRLHTLRHQQEQLSNIKTFLESEDISESIISFFQSLSEVERPKPILGSFEVPDSVDKYFGDEYYIDDIAEFTDEHAILFQDTQTKHEHINSKIENVYDGLCEILGVDLGNSMRENIITSVIVDNPDVPIDKDTFFASKFRSVKAELYKTNMAYKKSVDDMIAKKYKDEASKASTTYFMNVYIHVASMICLFVMTKYPSVTFNSVISSCISELSYSQSIYGYVACVLKSISSPDDERLSKIHGTSVEVLKKAMEDKAQAILEVRKDIAEALESNKDNLSLTLNKLVVRKSEHEEVFHGFKPTKDWVVQGDKLKLSDNINFKAAYKGRASVTDVVLPIANTVYVAKSTHVTSSLDYFKPITHDQISVIQHDNVHTRTKPKDKMNILGIDTTEFDNDKWWDTVLFVGLDSDFDAIAEFVSKNVTNVGSTFIELKSRLIALDDDTDSITQILHSFMRNTFPLLLAKLVNIRYLEADGDNFKRIVLNMTNAMACRANLTKCIDLLKSMRDSMWVFEPLTKQEERIKNKMVLIRILLTMLKHISCIDKASSEMFQSGEVQLGCDIVHMVCDRLNGYLEKNTSKQEEVKKRMEELREKRKMELMGAYKANDEDRQLQMTLKDMGLSTWFEVGETEEKREIHYPTDEENNRRMDDYVGLNDDGDGDEDLYAQIRIDD